MVKNQLFQNSNFGHMTQGLFDLIVPLVSLVHKGQKDVKVFVEVQGTLPQIFVPYERVNLGVHQAQRNSIP